MRGIITVTNQENNLQIYASGDNYWTNGIARLDRDEGLTFDDLVTEYQRSLVGSFMRGEYRLEDIRKVTQSASLLDGETSRLASQKELADRDQLELRTRRLAHHAIRATRNVVSSQSRVWAYCRRNKIDINFESKNRKGRIIKGEI